MARPQTDGGVESGGQSGQRSCRMEALRQEGTRQDAWRRSGLHALQTGCQPRLPRRDIATQTASGPALSPAHSPSPCPSPVCAPGTPTSETAGPDVTQSAERERGGGAERPGDAEPLADMLLQRRRAVGEAALHSDGGDWETDGDASGRVADQLRVIGDELNALILQRREAVQPLRDWRGLCWGLFTLITDTLSTLYVRRHR